MKLMIDRKKTQIFLAVILCLALLFAVGCSNNTALAEGESVTSIVPNANATDAIKSTDGENATSLLPAAINEYAVDKPEFLSPDMQKLYTAAHYLIAHHYINAGFDIDSSAPTIVATNGNEMYKDNGFATFTQYEEAMLATFTQSYYDYILTEVGMAYTAGEDGGLYTLAGARGTNVEYKSTSFELVSETDTEIKFTLISHLEGVPAGAAEGTAPAPYEERTSIAIVNTDDGWRFNGFGLAY